MLYPFVFVCCNHVQLLWKYYTASHWFIWSMTSCHKFVCHKIIVIANQYNSNNNRESTHILTRVRAIIQLSQILQRLLGWWDMAIPMVNFWVKWKSSKLGWLKKTCMMYMVQILRVVAILVLNSYYFIFKLYRR